MPRVATLIAVVGAVVVGLITAELLCSRFLVSPSFMIADDEFGTMPRCGAHIVESSEGYSGLRTTDCPDVARDFLEDEAVNSHRIIYLLGDSYTTALQVLKQNRFSDLLARRFPQERFVVSAQGGWYPPYYVQWLKTNGHARATDIAIIQLNDGDIFELDRSDHIQYVRDANGEFRLEAERFVRNQSRISRLHRWFLSRSGLYTFTSRRLRIIYAHEKVRLLHRGVAPEARDTTPDDAVERLLALDRDLRDMVTTVIYLYIPQLDYSSQGVRRSFPEVLPLYERFAKRANTRIIDMTTAFSADFNRSGQPLHGFSNSVIGTGHLNANGHAAVASAVAATLESVLQ